MLRILYIDPGSRPAIEKAGLLDERAILQWNHGERIVLKHWKDVFRCTLDGIGTVYVKRYFPQRNRWLGAVRKNLAVREFASACRLSRLGVPQPEPIRTALVVQRLGLPRCGVYMMREIENAEPLSALLERQRDAPDFALLEAIADELVRILNVMHAGNFCHWDFKTRNLLVVRRDGGVAVMPIDARSGKTMNVFTRWVRIRRDRRFLLREPLLRPLLERRWRNRNGAAPR